MTKTLLVLPCDKFLPYCDRDEYTLADRLVEGYNQNVLRVSTAESSCWSSLHKVQVKKLLSKISFTSFENKNEDSHISERVGPHRTISNYWNTITRCDACVTLGTLLSIYRNLLQ